VSFERVPLADLCSAPIVYGILQPGPEVPNGVPYVRPTEIQDHQIVLSEVRRTSRSIAADYQRSALEPDDVLFSIVGTIGKTALVPSALAGANITQSAVRVRANRDKAEPRFLQYALRSPDLVRQFDDLRLGTAVPRLNVAQVRTLSIPAPSIEVQRRIVASLDLVLSEIRAARNELQAIAPLAETLRRSVLAAASRGDLTADWRRKNPEAESASKLLERIRTERRMRWEESELARMLAKGRPPRDDIWKQRYRPPESVDREDLPALPPNWCWAAAEELTAPGRPILYGIVKPGPDTPGGVPYVRVMEMKDGTIDVPSLKRCAPARAALFSRATLQGGDILVSKDGTIGRVAHVPPELAGSNITQHVLRVSPSPMINNWFLSRAIESPGAQAWMTGEVRGVALQGINVEDFRRLPIPLAPRSEQAQVAAAIDRLLAPISALKHSVTVGLERLAVLERSAFTRSFQGSAR
jgi:type I restriction enzyme, S subunit